MVKGQLQRFALGVGCGGSAHLTRPGDADFGKRQAMGKGGVRQQALPVRKRNKAG